MTSQSQSPPVGDDELERIVRTLNLSIERCDWINGSTSYVIEEQAIAKAVAQTRAYILAEVKKIIGDDDTRPLVETYRGEAVSADFTRNKLRAELRQAATARFGGKS